LEKRLKELGKGIGDVTVGIFLRELRGTWKKAEPRPAPLELAAAEKLGIKNPRDLLKRLPIRKAIELETALVRFGKQLRRVTTRRAAWGKKIPRPAGKCVKSRNFR